MVVGAELGHYRVGGATVENRPVNVPPIVANLWKNDFASMVSTARDAA